MYKGLMRFALAMWGAVLLMTGVHVFFSDQGESLSIRIYIASISSIIVGGYFIYKGLFSKISERKIIISEPESEIILSESSKKNIFSKKENNIQHGLILFFVFCVLVIIFLMFA